MSKILKDGLHQNLKLLNYIVLCFLIMMMISCLISSTPLATFKSLLLPYILFIFASYFIFMILPRITFSRLLKHQLAKDGYDKEELENPYIIAKSVIITKHYIMHISTQTIFKISDVTKIIVKANHQITSLMFVLKQHHSRTLMLKTSIVDEVLNYLNDPSINQNPIELEKYHDENIKDEINIINVIMILTMLMLGLLIAFYF